MQTFSSLDATSIGFIILCIVIAVLAVMLIRLHMKMKKFLINVDSNNISDSLSYVSGELKDIKKFKEEMESYLTSVEKRLKKSVQSVHTVRFNPFKGIGAGGNQSFATAFLNEDGDGVLISSLYSREHVSVYSKPIRNKTSEHELSEEEAEALKIAVEKLSQGK